MKTTAFTLAALCGLAYGQAGTLSECAEDCTLQSLPSTECDLNDYPCLCADKAFFSTISSCISSNCSEQDATEAAMYAEELCASVGVPLPSAAGSGGTTGGSGGTTDCNTGVTTQMASMTMTDTMTDTMATPTVSVVSQTTMGMSNGTGGGAMTHSPPMATFTGAASSSNKVSWALGAMGALLVGAL